MTNQNTPQSGKNLTPNPENLTSEGLSNEASQPTRPVLRRGRELQCFSGARSTKPTPTSIDQVVHGLRNSAKLKKLTDNYRVLLKGGDSKRAVIVKRQAPGVTFSTTFHSQRTTNDIAAYTGLVMIDLDHCGTTQNMDRALKRLQADPHVMLSYTTLSDEGLRAVLPVDIDKEHPAEDFPACYAAAMSYVERLTGLQADEKCKDPTRLSFLAYDPEAYYNPDATPLPVPRAMTPAAGDAAPKAERRGRPRSENYNERCFDDVVRYVERSLGLTYTSGNHNKYLMLAAYKLNRLGVPQVDAETWMVQKYAGIAEDYGERAIRSIVKSAYGQVGQHGTERHSEYDGSYYTASSANGESHGSKRRRPMMSEIHSACELYADMRLNTFAGRIELRMKNQPEPRRTAAGHIVRCEPERSEDGFLPLSDYALNSLCNYLEPSLGYIAPRTVQATINCDMTPSYNPVTDYFLNLPAWDGRDRVQEMYDALTLKYADELNFCEMLRMWLTGLVAGAMGWDVNESILVLVGDQGVGKTTFFHALLPDELQSFRADLSIRCAVDKDTKFKLADNLLLQFEEVTRLNRDQMDTLNTLSTMNEINERRVYAINPSKLPRRGSLCATTNNPNFMLAASFGSRRWLLFHLLHADREKLAAIDKTQLFAQLLHHAEDPNYSIHMSPEEVTQICTFNVLHCKTREERLVKRFFRLVKTGESGGVWLTVDQVLEEVSNHGSHRDLDTDVLDCVIKNMGAPFRSEENTPGFYGPTRYFLMRKSTEEMKRDEVEGLPVE